MTKTKSTRKSSSRSDREIKICKKKREERPWSDLPNELLRLIARQCSFADQVRLRGVCKSWQSISGVQPAKQLPWLMAFNTNSCNLFDPSSKKTHFITMKRNLNREVQVCASKYGWLLLSEVHFCKETTFFFLYNPFINKVIELPGLNINSFIRIANASFSSDDPTSSDCVFFVFFRSFFDRNKTFINTCRPGDKTWTKHTFNGYFGPICNVAYSQGLFYCVDGCGKVGTFNADRSDWHVHNIPEPVLPDYRFTSYLVESDGEILMVVLSSRGVWTRIFMLDRGSKTMDWIQVEDIGDRVLFLGDASLSVSAPVVMPRNIGAIGKIYYFSESDEIRVIYSTKDSSRGYSCSKHHGSLAKEKYLKKIWIQHPHQ